MLCYDLKIKHMLFHVHLPGPREAADVGGPAEARVRQRGPGLEAAAGPAARVQGRGGGRGGAR